MLSLAEFDETYATDAADVWSALFGEMPDNFAINPAVVGDIADLVDRLAPAVDAPISTSALAALLDVHVSIVDNAADDVMEFGAVDDVAVWLADDVAITELRRRLNV